MVSVIYWAMLSRMFGFSVRLDVALIGLPIDKISFLQFKKDVVL